ncbi:hypothetical protein LN042_11645 [Kitasatospora sp. RB6PN24]|uniref:hypothetical protein n=1 Tax=Kitasatospora humi TaxID=2893891 RepID=UPI001E536D3C|nr:hypothetical protein [Kitasatospora humi]MCC9307743.1 hypothetical protein [Kitasatospora humi]
MSAREPLSAAQLESIERLLSRVTPGQWVVRPQSAGDSQVAAADGGVVAFGVRAAGDATFVAGAPEIVRLLVAELGWLAAELADARGLMAKTADNLDVLAGGDGELTVWHARNGDIPLGTYTHREDAQAHCADWYAATFPDPVTWYEDAESDGGLRMHVGHPDGEELESDYVVLPGAVRTSYDPDEEA